MSIIGIEGAVKLAKEAKSLEAMETFLDGTRKAENKGWHPDDVSIFDNLKPADRADMEATLKAAPLEKLIEFAVTGVAGANYLIPDKIYDRLYESAKIYDIAPVASPIVSCPGSSMKLDIEKAGQFKARGLAGGGSFPDETMEITQVTATPILFGIKARISNELIEDSQWSVMDTHIRRAGEEMGKYSTHLFIRDLIAGSDGDGTQNAANSGTADKTYFGDLADGFSENLADGWVSDTVIVGAGVLGDLLRDATVSVYSDQWHSKFLDTPIIKAGNSGENTSPLLFGNFMGMNVYVIPEVVTTAAAGGLYISSKWHSFVLDSRNAMLTVRKRWLKIENYSDPVRDLVGAVITSRQDQVSVHNDASHEITES
jgi:hypothetical protein